jgi:hypothetical protein
VTKTANILNDNSVLKSGGTASVLYGTAPQKPLKCGVRLSNSSVSSTGHVVNTNLFKFFLFFGDRTKKSPIPKSFTTTQDNLSDCHHRIMCCTVKKEPRVRFQNVWQILTNICKINISAIAIAIIQ